MFQQTWDQIQQEESTGASTGQDGWMEHFCGDSTVGRGCNAWIMKQALADQGHVLKYDKTL